jgi:hypothetical protein
VKYSRRLVAALFVALSAAGAGSVASAGPQGTPGDGCFVDIAGQKVCFVGGVIRNYPVGGWVILSKASGHPSRGLASVECRPNGRLWLWLTSRAESVTSVWAQADERLVRKGFAFGAAVTLERIMLTLTRYTADGPKPARCDDPVLVDEHANIWIGGVFGYAPDPPPA